MNQSATSARPTGQQLATQLLEQVALEHEDVINVKPALDVLAKSLVDESGLTPVGFQRGVGLLQDNLRRLAAIKADRKRYPDIAKVQIAPTVFILGMPRCGTSILHALLAADPQFRAPLQWEVAQPSPPPDAATFDTDPRAVAFDEFVRTEFSGKWQDVLKAHPIGARIPQECGMMLETAFRSSNPVMMYRTPEFFQWFLQADSTYGYQIHRMWLQHLQWRNPKPRWALKIQEHMYHMPELMAAYPDAIIIQAHRDPVTVIASITRLIYVIRSVSFDDQDLRALGREMLDLWNQGLVRLMQYRKSHPELRVYDLSYKQLVADPVGTLRELYRSIGAEFTAQSQAGVQRWLQENPADRHGKHKYQLSDYDLTERDVFDTYGHYIEAYRDYL